MADQQQGSKAATKSEPKTDPAKPKQLPPWKVLLHNDDVNTYEFVTRTLYELTPLNWDQSLEKTDEAHKKGLSLVLTAHKERAELYQDQLKSKGLTVTIEQDEE